LTEEERKAAIEAAIKKRGAKIEKNDEKASFASTAAAEKEKRNFKKPKNHGTAKLY